MENTMNRQELRQVREAVRQSPLYKIKAYLGLSPKVALKGQHPRYSVYPVLSGITEDQEIAYCISRGNLLTMKGDFWEALRHFRFAYSGAVSEVQKRTRERNEWAKLSKSEQKNIVSDAYESCSGNDRDYWQEQTDVSKRLWDLRYGNTKPSYNTQFLKRLRAGVKFWSRKVSSSNKEKDEIWDETAKDILEGLETIV